MASGQSTTVAEARNEMQGALSSSGYAFSCDLSAWSDLMSSTSLHPSSYQQIGAGSGLSYDSSLHTDLDDLFATPTQSQERRADALSPPLPSRCQGDLVGTNPARGIEPLFPLCSQALDAEDDVGKPIASSSEHEFSTKVCSQPNDLKH